MSIRADSLAEHGAEGRNGGDVRLGEIQLVKAIRENPHQFCDPRFTTTGPQLVYLRVGRGTVLFKLGCYESLKAAIADGSEPQASLARFIHRTINQKARLDR